MSAIRRHAAIADALADGVMVGPDRVAVGADEGDAVAAVDCTIWIGPVRYAGGAQLVAAMVRAVAAAKPFRVLVKLNGRATTSVSGAARARGEECQESSAQGTEQRQRATGRRGRARIRQA